MADRLGAGRPVDPPTAILPTVTPATHPPTLVERPLARVASPAVRAEVPPNRLTGALVVGAVVLLLALVGALVLDGRSGPSPTAAPVATPTGRPSTVAPPAAARPTPTRAGTPAPVTARQLRDRFADLLDRAQAVRLVDRKTADDLRKKATELDRGRPKERAKRIEDLHERIEDAVDDDKLDGTTAAALRELLDAYDRLRGGDQG
ncbi:hypothetical protein [Micromonospora sp. WMMD980]|uniref:hypothetical protein n=1 Tax=Micromonospora sp. WMMD980 TaxID=3016088 RepID=UPI003241E2DD